MPDKANFYRELMVAELDENAELKDRLLAVRKEAEAELARVERHGGCAGFALRVLALAKGD